MTYLSRTHLYFMYYDTDLHLLNINLTQHSCHHCHYLISNSCFHCHLGTLLVSQNFHGFSSFLLAARSFIFILVCKVFLFLHLQTSGSRSYWKQQFHFVSLQTSTRFFAGINDFTWFRHLLVFKGECQLSCKP